MLRKKLPSPDFATRSNLPEIMDGEVRVATETQLALNEIGTINKWLGGYKVILNALEKMQWSERTITIVDIGCGGGDTLRAIATWAIKNNRVVKLIGVDRNPVMTEYAASLSRSYTNIEYVVMDVFDTAMKEMKADIMMNSLFCHHFNNVDLVKLIGTMHRCAVHSVIINDIDRHWLAYYSIKVLTRLFSKSYMVKYDAPLSVARSLTKHEWENILLEAGIHHYTLRWMWAWRWQIVIPKTGGYGG